MFRQQVAPGIAEHTEGKRIGEASLTRATRSETWGNMTRDPQHRFWLAFAIALGATAPALAGRILGWAAPPIVAAILAGVAILAAGFMLSWAVEGAEEHVAPGLALAILALITVLPEFVVDFYYAFQGGQHPGSDYVHFAAANMTGANRLLVGFGWPSIALLYWWRSGQRSVPLKSSNSVEILFLFAASAYSFLLVFKQRIDVIDAVLLFALYGAYIWRLARESAGTKHDNNAMGSNASDGDGDGDEDDDDDDREVGPGAALEAMPKRTRFQVMGLLCVIAAAVIVAEAEPFAEALLATATQLGANHFFVVQWISPLAGELPEMVIAILFTLSLRPGHALGALVSDKINQWTLLLGSLPLIFSFGSGHLAPLELGPRQTEEVFLTAAQSLFAVTLLLRLRFRLVSAVIMLLLFVAQIAIALATQHDESSTILWLTHFAWLYLALSVVCLISNWRAASHALVRGLGLAFISARQSRSSNVPPTI